MPARSSRCSEGAPVEFHWYPPMDGLSAKQAALKSFAEVMNPPGRQWDRYQWILTKAEFERRLDRAMAGELVPVDHVKDIDRDANEALFEIRWSIGVVDTNEAGERWPHKVQVRLYHAEPPAVLATFVGLHVHEKIQLPDDHQYENDLQNNEIDLAIRRYELGRATNWGIP